MKIKTVTVFGKRWFDRVNGNTYFSNQVYVNGDYVGGIDYEYGYGEMYMQRARDILAREGIIEFEDDFERLWQARDRLGFKLINLVADVGRKKDL